MFSKQMLKLVFVLTLLLMGLMPAMAQEGMPPLPGEVLVGDLGAPRGLAFDTDGNLLIAVAGTGGETWFNLAGPDGEQPVNAGLSGRVISIAPDGTTSNRIEGLPSYAFPMETGGVYRIIPHNESLWLLFSGTGSGSTGAFWADSVVEYDAETLVVKNVINLNNFEATHDPDGNGYDTNVADIAWGSDGTMYIVNAGGNDLLSWTADGGLQLVHAWSDNPVPTSIEVAVNDDLYIGFLGAGMAPGAGKIEHWSDGELIETFGGLNTVTDILLDNDTLYAVQLTVFTDQGPGPGSVVTVSADGATPIAEGLPAPFGIAQFVPFLFFVAYVAVISVFMWRRAP